MMRESWCFVLVSFLVVACGSSQSTPEIVFCGSATEVIFDPGGKWLLPFPSDLYLAEDPSTPGGHRIDLNPSNIPTGEDMFEVFPFMVEQLNSLDGFGTSAAIVFGFSREIGSREQIGEEYVVAPPPSLAIAGEETTGTNSPVVLIDIDENSPTRGQAVPVLLEYLSDEDARGTNQHYLVVEPAFALRPKTTYALALTGHLTDKNGACLAPSESTQELLSGKGEQDFGLLGQAAPVAVQVLAEGGFVQGPGDLSALTVFTTQSIDEEILAATADILEEASGTPPGIVPGSLVTEPGSDGVALVVHGRFEATQYRTEEGTFVIENNRPVPQETEELEFELVIPEATIENQPPFPLVIYQHGLIGEKGEDMGAKRAQARAGFASLAIDAVLHGTRKAATGWEVTNFFAIDLDTGHFDMPVLRDNFRQCFLDIVSLAELVPALSELDLLPEGAPDGVAEIRNGPVYLSGHSLGGIIGAGAVSLSPRIPIANLSAGGGALPSNLFMRSDIFGTFIDMMRPEDTTAADVRRFMPILQILTERGDPVNLVRLANAEPPDLPGAAHKHVLFQEVVDDAFVPNQANEALGRALGLSHLQPVVRPVTGLSPVAEPASANHPNGVSAGFFQFDVLSDGAPAEHTDIYSDTVAQTQWIHFFKTYRDTGVPELIDPYRVLGIERP